MPVIVAFGSHPAERRSPTADRRQDALLGNRTLELRDPRPEVREGGNNCPSRRMHTHASLDRGKVPGMSRSSGGPATPAERSWGQAGASGLLEGLPDKGASRLGPMQRRRRRPKSLRIGRSRRTARAHTLGKGCPRPPLRGRRSGWEALPADLRRARPNFGERRRPTGAPRPAVTPKSPRGRHCGSGAGNSRRCNRKARADETRPNATNLRCLGCRTKPDATLCSASAAAIGVRHRTSGNAAPTSSADTQMHASPHASSLLAVHRKARMTRAVAAISRRLESALHSGNHLHDVLLAPARQPNNTNHCAPLPHPA